MRLDIYSRLGHFNLMDTREESISCSVRVYDNKGNFIKGCSFTPEYEINTNDFVFESIAEEIADMIEAYQKQLWISTSREKDLEFAKWLRENKTQIAKGCRENRIKILKAKKKAINTELKSLKIGK